MPAKSKKQQRFFGMVHARQKGEDVGGPEVAKVAGEIDFKDAKDFASTKHKGLPEKVKDKDKKKKKDKDKKNEWSLWEQYKARRDENIVPGPPPPHSGRERQSGSYQNAQGKEVQYPKVPSPKKKLVPRPREDNPWKGNPFGNK